MKISHVLVTLAVLLAMSFPTKAQIEVDDYRVVLEGQSVAGLDALHSFVHGSWKGNWIILAGRKDGLHARQPFAAFPALGNNNHLYIVNEGSLKADSVDLNKASLSSAIIEQLQSTNSQFYQDGQYLLQIGGYGYSASKGSHITYDGLIRIDLDGLLNDINAGRSISSNFVILRDSLFHLTGGALGKIDTVFQLVGGQTFTGAYNPMGHATYVQTYSEQIRKFSIAHKASSFTFKHEGLISDVANLHRRDFSMAPQIFPNGEYGYTLFSGVFQLTKDLPFLQPVDIKKGGHILQASFNQYLSNYHGARIALYNNYKNMMHTIFLGGMAQYYYNGTSLMQDNNVPFVRTISRVSRDDQGILKESAYPDLMPGFLGASAEFIPNRELSKVHNEIITVDSLKGDTIMLGYLVGGIESPIVDAFVTNRTGLTQANDSIYKVYLVKSTTGFELKEMNGHNAVALKVFPNPIRAGGVLNYHISSAKTGPVSIYITSIEGKLLYNRYENIDAGQELDFRYRVKNLSPGVYIMQVLLDGRYWSHAKFEVMGDP